MEQNEPQLFVTSPSLPPVEEYIACVRDIFSSRWLTNSGAYYRRLEQALTDRLGVKNVSLFVNGHLALELCLQALGLSGEVITTPYTFASTTHAIVRNGLTPVFCDIDPETFTIDTEKLEALVTERTCAIVPVHVYGNICNVDAIDAVARKHGLKVIYDAAHTFGETWRGRPVGTLGDASMFSFHATKVFNSVEGGAITTADAALVERLARLKDFGICGEEAVTDVGANAKMNEMQAAMGLCNLRYVDEWIDRRGAVVARYRERLGGLPGVQLNRVDPDVRANNAYFPAVFDPEAFGTGRDAVRDALKQHNIFARKYFYPIVTAFACYRDRFRPEETPVAKRVSERVLTLPLSADMTPDDADRVCDVIAGLAR